MSWLMWLQEQRLCVCVCVCLCVYKKTNRLFAISWSFTYIVSITKLVVNITFELLLKSQSLVEIFKLTFKYLYYTEPACNRKKSCPYSSLEGNSVVSELGYIVTHIFRVHYEHIVLYSFAGWVCVLIPLAVLWTCVDCLLFIEVSITVMPTHILEVPSLNISQHWDFVCGFK